MRLCLIWLIAVLVWLTTIPMHAGAQGGGPLYTTRQRFGVNLVRGFSDIPGFPGSLTDFADIQGLGLGWYSDWGVRRSPEHPGGVEFVQTLDVSIHATWPPDWNRIESAAQANPGSLWIVGNEPETRGQGELTPAEYAIIYHEAYHKLKEYDPTCQVAIGGVVMPTPLRLEWLDMCLDHYQTTYGKPMPIDVWNTHMQILQEDRYGWGCGVPYGLDEDRGRLYGIADNANVEAFEQLIREFRAWLADPQHPERGGRDKPLIITEYAVLMPSSYLVEGDTTVLEFMEGTFDFMLTARDADLGYSADQGRLVQRWSWYSLNCPFCEYDPGGLPGGYNGALYYWENPEQLTPFGQFYRIYARNLVFLPWTLRPAPTPTPTMTNTPTTTPTASPTPTATATSTPTSTSTASPTATLSHTLTASVAVR